MSLVRREHFEFPELWRRFFDTETDSSWMRIEEFLDGDTLVVRAELPGIDPDKDVELTITEGVLQMRARREEKSEHKSKDSYHSEFRYGSFVRSFRLPEGTKEEDVQASYRDGILEIRLPVSEMKAATTRIAVTQS
ncbi:MAG: Hsp20/alpha crystallin family protein [Acidimicrobiales bacterium]|jgi:HSP20 family protein